MIKCKNKIWIENISDLFCNFQILPLGCDTLESKINAITRFIIIIFILLLLVFNIKISLVFLTLSLTIIIIYYYISKNKKMSKENFMYKQKSTSPQLVSPKMFAAGPNGYAATYRAKQEVNPKNKQVDIILDRPTAYRFCNDDVEFNFNNISENGVENFMYNNQKLAGQCNPKTLIPPVITPPCADLSYWKANNLVTHSHVNDMRQIDNYRSGYQVSSSCGNTSGMYINNNGSDGDVLVRPTKASNKQLKYKNNNYDNNKIFSKENNVMENFEMNTRNDFPPVFEIKPNESGQINLSCGYNPSQLSEAGLPTNYGAGNCEKDPLFKNYNQNLFTQTIQPGAYSYNEVNEPINSNIGISFTQQFEPVTRKTSNNGNVLYTEHDPRIFDDNIIEPIEETVNESNVYDPRFSGYGTSYRSYTDNNLGQTKFYYDDINSIRMPNYIARSTVDFLPFADTYGPMVSGDGNENNSVIRDLVDDAWTRNSLEFRTGMQQSLMRKRNAEGWQQRQAPIHKGNQRMLRG
jgi:hypothetical protein